MPFGLPRFSVIQMKTEYHPDPVKTGQIGDRITGEVAE
jgi:hypothetical protein